MCFHNQDEPEYQHLRVELRTLDKNGLPVYVWHHLNKPLHEYTPEEVAAELHGHAIALIRAAWKHMQREWGLEDAA